MKKTVKSLIIAASVAAIAGIGAVSFAAWQGGSYTEGTAGGTLGSISAYGFDEELDVTLDKELMPYDQESLASDQVAVWSVALPTVTATAATKLQVKLTSDPDLNANSGIYVTYSATDVTAAPSDLTGYQKLTTGAADLSGATYSANAQATAGGYLVVVLDSEALSDMSKTFNITVEIVEAA